MKTNVRHNCLEVPLSDTEKSRIDAHCIASGLARAVFARFSMLQAIESNLTANKLPMESLPCRDTPIASRAWLGITSVRQHHRRVALPGRSAFGSRTPKRLL
ncbi:hypothetical protein [Duganella sp. BJB475]|uniref:hypothetical protein n=1 Tax=Duganella sp. BJB475 TaxID=2233914 RepID=UPI0011C11368|nr:hypothetical protein [Duganella sp. BJB475]